MQNINGTWLKEANRIRRQQIGPYRSDGGTVIANVRRSGMKTGDRPPMHLAPQLWPSRGQGVPPGYALYPVFRLRPEKAGVDGRQRALMRGDRRRQSGLTMALRKRNLKLVSALGQAEHTLTDDVVLNLVSAGRDGAAPRRQHPMRPLAMIDCPGGLVLELAMRA